MAKTIGAGQMGAGAIATLRASAQGTIGPLIERLGAPAREALRDGRVFVGRRRATVVDDPIALGEDLFVYPPRRATASARVLAEHDGVLAVFKPAAMATLPDQRGIARTLLGAVVELTASTPDAWHATSRLDVGVSGVVLFTRTPDARARLRAARERGEYLRRYVAIALRAPDPDHGVWSAPIGRAPHPKHRKPFGDGAAPAVTLFATAARARFPVHAGLHDSPDRPALLAVSPLTGRTHQIRVHASHAGAPLLGDAAYGGPTRVVSLSGAITPIARVALHAAWVRVPDAAGKPWRVEAPVPDDVRDLWGALGGPADAFDAAVSIDLSIDPDVR